MLYDLTYMWKIKSKGNKQMKTDSDTENTQVVAKGEEGEGGEIVKGI